jgi:anthranilate phosphoribosyltransferase
MDGGYFEHARQLATSENEQEIEKILVHTPVNLESLVGFYNYFSKQWEVGKQTLDIVGTGGDKKNTFNISTSCAILLAGMDVPITKFGNRAASSSSGSMDVLGHLGISTAKNSSEVQHYLEQANISFINASEVYTDFSRFSNVRKKIGKPTILNYLGPLLNPVKDSFTVLGVYSNHFEELYLKVFERLRKANGAIINGHGFDEAIPTHETNFTTFSGNKYWASHSKGGYAEALKIAGPEQSAKIILEVFSGKDKSIRRDCVLLNSAIAYSVFTGKGLTDSYIIARNALDSGKANAVVDKLRNVRI